MNKRTVVLRQRADDATEELSQHPVLNKHWNKLSLVLKGSTARGKTDKYSDIDLVLYCDESLFPIIVDEYHQRNMINRNDGLFIHCGEWPGHYNLETIQNFQRYFTSRRYPQIWEYQNAILLHDPGDQLKQIIEDGSKELFPDLLSEVRSRYLDLQLTLDWMRHPLKRGDYVSGTLHAARLLEGICQLCYVLDGLPYPHDKWVFHYIGTTSFGRTNKNKIKEFASVISADFSLPKHLDVLKYPQYALAQHLIQRIERAIQKKFGSYPWIAEWYYFV